MALPFVAGLIIGGGAILLFNKRKEITHYTQEKLEDFDIRQEFQRVRKGVERATQKATHSIKNFVEPKEQKKGVKTKRVATAKKGSKAKKETSLATTAPQQQLES